MSAGGDFFDSNVILYGLDAGAPKAKQEVSRDLIERAVAERSAVISWEVVQETLHVVVHRFKATIAADDRLALLNDILLPLWKNPTQRETVFDIAQASVALRFRLLRLPDRRRSARGWLEAPFDRRPPARPTHWRSANREPVSRLSDPRAAASNGRLPVAAHSKRRAARRCQRRLGAPLAIPISPSAFATAATASFISPAPIAPMQPTRKVSSWVSLPG